jgi:V/A-type H+-transporting ATPase subunit I
MVGKDALMTPAKMKKFTAIVLDTELDKTLRFLASLGVAHFIDIKHRSEELGTELELVEASDRFYHLSNLLTRITTLITNMKVMRGGGIKEPLEVPEVPSTEYLSNLEKQIKQIEDAFEDYSSKLEKANEAGEKSAKKALQKEIKNFAAEHRDNLLAWEEILQREHRLEETKTLFGKTKRTYIIAGWIPAKQAKDFVQSVQKHCHDSVALEVTDYHEPHHDHEEGEEVIDRPPTKLTNPKQLKSYENLTNAFGTPSHREIDPTWFLAIGFPIIFGIMFGDIGHGLLLLFFASLGMIAKKKQIDAGEMVNYFIQGSGLIALCAVFSIFFGVLYGEFLGIDIVHLEMYQALKFSPFGTTMKGFLVNLFSFFDFDGGVNWFLNPLSPYNLHVSPIWFSAFESPAHLPANVASPTWLLFVLSIIIGFIHLSIAIIIDLINKIRQKEWKHALFGPAIWIWFFWGLAVMLFTKGINFMGWFSYYDPSGQQANILGNPMTDALLFLILPLLLMIVGGMLAFGVMEGFMEGLEHLIASISNTISYARILALNMAHAGFAKTFLFIGGVAETEILYVIGALTNGELSLIMFILMLFIGTIFVLLMEGLLSFIHCLRLHWVEAYLKFYSGTGYPYDPLTIPSKWTKISTTAIA